MIQKDPVEIFTENFVRQCPVLAHIPANAAVSRIEDVTGVLLFRDGDFQVQMFIVPPDYIIPAHTHPNVDSCEVYVGGQIKFSLNGQFVCDGERDGILPDGTSVLRGNVTRVRPGDRHGGVFGPAGGVFLSCQHWLNGIAPHCVAADYTGPVMGSHHMEHVKFGIPEMRSQKQLTEQDAL